MAANKQKSKRRSGASSAAPPGPLIFITDETLGRRTIPEALRAAGAEVKVYRDLFSPGLVDREWLRIAGERGWVVLTKDSGIKNRRNEMERLLSCDARTFILAGNDFSGSEIGASFVKALPGIKKICAEVAPPFIAQVQRSGRVVVMASN
jgi:hypothetical protein